MGALRMKVFALDPWGKWHETSATYQSSADTICGKTVLAFVFVTLEDPGARLCEDCAYISS